jgi:antitoxin HicB
VTLLTYAKDGRDIPPAGVVAKIAFIEAFRTSGKTRVELARRLDKNESEIRRMFDPYHRTKLGALEER